ncbi:kanamycin kinase/aminoglycoside 3'-phosphotransferase-2 [Asanoa ferruginea]|uniref:Kanamycin kinase/aminoglycoside 3'-phosphotransferase-2 n=1 Tax=Asanoa ferruginea TaxID=53367 RepID=A0A3D9ZEV2_9ACTN|nr:aminoglycoside 3'-phosphotransferase [Asanoa ferruginea]REF95389.1 kanamycin kinase/aminoglycoside 3'-phosphotransferase-2 [Asanoa ferruginea]GIF48479.1 aminoglycoside O-phosphotransferase APH(3')-IIb [Asanoa ferruginea]
MTDWLPVSTGKSGARVWRGDGHYRKEGPPAEIAAEADRLTWLGGQGFPCPSVVDHSPGRLITTALPGRAGDDPGWPDWMRPRLAAGLGELLRRLHALPVSECPFDHTLARTIPEAETAEVDLTDLDPNHAGWSGDRLLRELHATRPATPEDLVVGHGDPTRANVLFAADGTPTGMVDVSRLGVADRHNDLAIATRSFTAWSPNLLAAYGVPDPDPAKITFYRLLDEFC